MREFHAIGKHFVPADLLRTLNRARSLLPELNCPWSDVRTLACFLESRWTSRTTATTTRPTSGCPCSSFPPWTTRRPGALRPVAV